MPLQPGKSDAAFKANVSEMVKAGHPLKNALAAAYKTSGRDNVTDSGMTFLTGLRSFAKNFLDWIQDEEEEPEHNANDETPKPTKQGAGCAFITNDGKVLFLKRSDQGDEPGTWCFPGGMAEEGETPEQAARREIHEEIGDCVLDEALSAFDEQVDTDKDLGFTTFIQPVAEDFEPTLNNEHIEYKWCGLDELPEPLHPGVASTIERAMSFAKDMLFKKVPGGESPTVNLSPLIKREAKLAAVTPEQERVQKEAPKVNAVGDDVDKDGKLSQTARKEIGTVGSEHREDMPESAFLIPSSRKYPVQEKEDGKWKFTKNLLLAAERRAVTQGRRDLANKAKAIREREFPEDKSTIDEKLVRLADRRSGGAADAAAAMAFDWSGCARLGIRGLDQTEMAFDRESMREKDLDGHLHLKRAIIAKSAVNSYFGNEIPGYKELGLDPKKEYKLYRHPDELKKAIRTSNRMPILSSHKEIDAATHDKNAVIGATGDSAEWEAPYVYNTLVFWPQEAIDEIENNSIRALSPGYRYDPDMTPGVTPEGEPYDGVMRGIKFSHLAKVEEGRQGPDVVVGDAKLKISFSWKRARFQ